MQTLVVPWKPRKEINKFSKRTYDFYHLTYCLYINLCQEVKNYINQSSYIEVYGLNVVFENRSVFLCDSLFNYGLSDSLIRAFTAWEKLVLIFV